MSLLSEEEIEACAADDDGSDDMAFARAIEAAILAKLASAELPEPYGWAKQSEIEQHARFGGSVNLWRRKFDNDTTFFTADQLTAWGSTRFAQGFAAGAAAQLADKPVAFFDVVMDCAYTMNELGGEIVDSFTPLYTRREA